MEQENKKQVWWKPAVEIFGQVSSWVVVPVVLSLIIGKYLDGRFGTKPWIFLGLTGVAFFISIFGIVKTVGVYIKDIKKEEKKENGNGNTTN